MRAAHLILGYIRNLSLAFYRALLKLSINAHQLIAYWRSRISRKQSVVVDLNLGNEDIKLRSQVKSTESCQEENSIALREVNTSQQSGLSINTPNSRRLKLYSLVRRLSLRNFMEYCVIALNEASSSTCSNKFDLSLCDRTVWLLGQQYELPQDVDRLVDDVRSRFWITYRRNFPPIDDNTRYTTDRGFGCMIRCGQMVLANALLHKNLGREWRWSSDGLEANPDVYTRILKLFQDKKECPYSIHNIVLTGQQEGKIVGEWFGPNTIAQALKRIALALLTAERASNEVLISIEAALDNVVVVDEIKSKFKQNGKHYREKVANKSSESVTTHEKEGLVDSSPNRTESNCEQWTPGILFIQLRLGLNKINPLYFAALKKTFQFESSLGIIGGRPNHALYLIGYTDDDIIYLDPHSTQQYIDFDTGRVEDEVYSGEFKSLPIDATYHCASPEKMSIDRLDPSLALCFYFHTEQEFDRWCSLSEELLIKSEQAPMFEITKSRPSGWNIPLNSTVVKSSCEPCLTQHKIGVHGLEKHQMAPNYDEQRFTIIKESGQGIVDDLESKSADVGAPDEPQTNDDEEFEMLG